MEKVTIVMISGGVDSTGALYRLLSRTDNSIFAHHINFINHEGRAGTELAACTEIVSWLKTNVRPFDYSVSTLVWPLPHIGWDIINAMYLGGIIAKSLNGPGLPEQEIELCIGDTKDDFGAYKWKSPIAQSVALIAALEDPRIAKQYTPTIIQPVVDLTKKEIIEMMPNDLFDLTWSCRRPIVDENRVAHTCGECITCQDLKNIGYYQAKEMVTPKYHIDF